MLNDEPGSVLLVTEAGETPGPALADPKRAKARAVVMMEKRMVEGCLMEVGKRGGGYGKHKRR